MNYKKKKKKKSRLCNDVQHRHRYFIFCLILHHSVHKHGVTSVFHRRLCLVMFDRTGAIDARMMELCVLTVGSLMPPGDGGMVSRFQRGRELELQLVSPQFLHWVTCSRACSAAHS